MARARGVFALALPLVLCAGRGLRPSVTWRARRSARRSTMERHHRHPPAPIASWDAIPPTLAWFSRIRRANRPKSNTDPAAARVATSQRAMPYVGRDPPINKAGGQRCEGPSWSPRPGSACFVSRFASTFATPSILSTHGKDLRAPCGAALRPGRAVTAPPGTAQAPLLAQRGNPPPPLLPAPLSRQALRTHDGPRRA